MNHPAGRDTEPKTPLQNRVYRELWSANALSNFGGQIQVVGAAWLMASLTNSPQMIALVQTAINLSTVFFILAGGALADNFDRRRIMLTAQIAMLAVAGLLAGLAFSGAITPWLLLALTFTISACGSLNNPAWQASVRDILPRRLISQAVALNSTSINLARTVGPALGGGLVLVAGSAAAFAVNAISFVGFIIALLRWKPKRTPRTLPRERIFPAMATGIRFAALAPHLRNIVIRGHLSGLSASAAFALLPVVARQEMGGSAVLYGMLLAAFGTGAVLSGYSGGKLRAIMTPEKLVRISTTAMTIGLATLALAPYPILAAIGAALCGGGWTLTHSTYNTTVQMSTPQWVTARSLATYQTSTFAGMALGSLVFGAVAEHHGAPLALLIASGVHFSGGIISLFLPLPRLDEVKTDPLDNWRPPALDKPLDPQDGPIQVEIEYQIDAEHQSAFHDAMRQRKLIRMRDGARDWTLWHDIEHHDCWVESYHVPTWADYLRHNSRRTVADRANMEALVNLNANPNGTVIRRYQKHKF